MAANKDECEEPNTAKKASLLQMIHSSHITSYQRLTHIHVNSLNLAMLLFDNKTLDLEFLHIYHSSSMKMFTKKDFLELLMM